MRKHESARSDPSQHTERLLGMTGKLSRTPAKPHLLATRIQR